MSAKHIACTSPLRGRRRCGISSTVPWPVESAALIWCRPHWAGISCRTRLFAMDRPGAACCSCGWTNAPTAGPDLVDLLPAGHVPEGFLPILQAYDYAGDEVTLVHADDARLRRMAVFDVLINNADRKGGHILCGVDGQ